MEKNNSSGTMNNPLVLIIILLALVAVAVGAFLFLSEEPDDNDSNDTDIEESADDTRPADDVEPPVFENIVDTAIDTPTLSTLVEAVVAADLDTTLADETAEYTVFAPSNTAFNDIQQTIDTLLLEENQSQLQNVLLYHVVLGSVFSDDITDGMVVESANGESIKIRVIDGNVYVNGAMVTLADVETSNGVVHIIDEVLVPGEFGNIVDTASETPDFTTLVAAVQAGELVETLSAESAEFTVFAPTNDAFAAIQPTVDSLLLPENLAELQSVLTYHVVPSEVFSSELRDGQIVETVNGQTLTVNIAPAGDVTLTTPNGVVSVVQADILTSNGVIHVVDQVLVP